MKFHGSEDETSFKDALKNIFCLFIIKSLPWGKIIALFGIFVKEWGKIKKIAFSMSSRNFGEE